MWQYTIKKETFEATEHSEACEMYFVCEDFGECGHTTYESAGLMVGETENEVREILALMLLDCCDGNEAEAFIAKMRTKYTKTKCKKEQNDT